jgi:hypothetical protein
MANEDANTHYLYLGAGILGAGALGTAAYYGYKKDLHAKAWEAMKGAYGTTARAGSSAAYWLARKHARVGLSLRQIAEKLGK